MDTRSEIENLLFLYAERVDAGDFAGVADLFVDGDILGPDGEVAASGRAAVLALYQNSTRRYADDGTPHTKHVTSNVILEVAACGTLATARSYFTVYQQTEDLPLQAIIAGRYHDRFKKVQGRWQFKQRRMLPDLFGDLSKHLLLSLDRKPTTA